MSLSAIHILDYAAVAWFAACYFGYGWAVNHGPLKGKVGLVAAVELRRVQWMRAALHRDVRIMDAQLMTSLSSGTAFFASTTVIVLGGLAAMLGAADNVKIRLEQLPFVGDTAIVMWELKIMFMMALVIRAFFKFAWAFRLTHYLGIMLGAMPAGSAEDLAQGERHIAKTARLASIAATHTNDGLRTIYFAIAGLGWFLHPLIFMAACTWVLWVVYRREYRSNALAAVGDSDV
ncbi:MAG: DUF599 family protein [Alphaproteobacteria bacterium]|nr:DUF599 family protein [Alphaproteobacteria bacterium]